MTKKWVVSQSGARILQDGFHCIMIKQGLIVCLYGVQRHISTRESTNINNLDRLEEKTRTDWRMDACSLYTWDYIPWVLVKNGCVFAIYLRLHSLSAGKTCWLFSSVASAVSNFNVKYSGDFVVDCMKSIINNRSLFIDLLDEYTIN